MAVDTTLTWPDGRQRCRWCNPQNPLYIAYHDAEWGVPCHDDHRLFEMLVLEGFQAGLSWECVLNKRDGFRQAFDGLDASVIARYPDEKLEALRQDSRIIRNKLKIRAARTSGAVLMPICGTGRMERSYTNGIVPGLFCRIRFRQISRNGA